MARELRFSILALVLTMSGCFIVANADYDPDAGQEGTSGNADAEGTAAESEASTVQEESGSSGATAMSLPSTSTGDAPDEATTMEEPEVACGMDLPTSGGGPCPQECDRCVDGVCWFDCETEQACKEAMLMCAPGRACGVNCGAHQGCANATVVCPLSAHPCTVACNGEKGCEKIHLECGGGTCELACGDAPDACKDARLHCGTNEGLVSCSAADESIKLEEDPASSCSCAVGPSCDDGGDD